MSLTLRLAIGASIPILIWGALYIVIALAHIVPRRLTPWLRGGIFLALPAMIVFEVTDLNHVASIAGIFFFTFLGADFWLQRHNKISSAKSSSQPTS
jgi:integral membrane sensor domain MASE1